jgi:hypothetical protein
MAERLPDFPDLATPAARETIPPPFERIVERVRRRRRHNRLAVAGVTVAVVAGVGITAALDLGQPDSTPRPVAPSPSPTTNADNADRIVTDGNLSSFAGSDDGSVLTVWRACADEREGTKCHSAWQLQGPDGTHRGTVMGELPVAYAAGNTFVVASSERDGIAIDDTGGALPLVRVEEGIVSRGDVLVRSNDGLAVVDPKRGDVWQLFPASGFQGWAQGMIAADGTTWAMPALDQESWIAWQRGGDSGWEHHVMPAENSDRALPGYVAVAGDRVAAVSGYDGATILPVADVAVTTDGGESWVDLHHEDLPFDTVDGLAATSGGTLYVVTAGGEHLFRSADSTWTRFVEVPNPRRLAVLQPAGRRVLAQGGTRGQPLLFALDDDGEATLVPLDR